MRTESVALAQEFLKKCTPSSRTLSGVLRSAYRVGALSLEFFKMGLGVYAELHSRWSDRRRVYRVALMLDSKKWTSRCMPNYAVARVIVDVRTGSHSCWVFRNGPRSICRITLSLEWSSEYTPSRSLAGVLQNEPGRTHAGVLRNRLRRYCRVVALSLELPPPTIH